MILISNIYAKRFKIISVGVICINNCDHLIVQHSVMFKNANDEGTYFLCDSKLLNRSVLK